jgi:hypothetical protein
LTLADFKNELVDVWPDCLRSVTFFDALGAGCWVVGNSGPIGLRPEAFTEVKLAKNVTAEEWPQIYSDVCVMEAAALAVMRKGK